MPDPYDDFLFGNDEKKKKKFLDENSEPLDFSKPYTPPENQKEPLDEILERNRQFEKKAETFSKILSQAKAIDHKVDSGIARFFLSSDDKKAQNSMRGEKEYHSYLTHTFVKIISTMRELAEIHQASVQQFNDDIDNDYYSLDKIDKEVDHEISLAIEQINTQRKILAEGSKDLDIFENALEETERRLKKYIDAGGKDNISQSEVLLLISKREQLTSGKQHHFDYSFFKLNLLDKAATSLGWYMKETTSQYLNKLIKALN